MKKSTKKGFTLVELVIVIAVIAILSAILVPTFGNIIQNANVTKAHANAKAAITTHVNAIAAYGIEDDIADATGTIYVKSGEYVFEYVNGNLKTTAVEGPSEGGAYTGQLYVTYDADGTDHVYNTDVKYWKAA